MDDPQASASVRLRIPVCLLGNARQALQQQGLQVHGEMIVVISPGNGSAERFLACAACGAVRSGQNPVCRDLDGQGRDPRYEILSIGFGPLHAFADWIGSGSCWR
jgi:hypothetical protein